MLLQSLLCLLLITTCQPTKAMFLDAQPERHAPKLVQLNPKWECMLLDGKLPREITIVDSQTPINDELLATLNPEWKDLSQKLTQDEKNELLAISFQYPGGDQVYYTKRCLVAEAIAIGAAPSIGLSSLHCAALSFATLRYDGELVKYVLTKLTPEQRMSEKIAFLNTSSSQIAELLFAADVQMPEDILVKCVMHGRSAELMKFYLQNGANPNALCDYSTALHTCIFEAPRVKYIPLLLDAGADISLKNRNGYTIFRQALEWNNHEFIECVIDHFLKKEEAVIISYLGCLKKKAPKFYSETKHLHQLLFRCFSPLVKLKQALKIKDKSGETAYEIYPLEILNPANCTYAKLRKLRVKSVECTPLTNDIIE